MRFCRRRISILFITFLISGFAGAGYVQGNKAAEGKLVEVAPDVYHFQDICNVYVLKSGNTALLIDAGSGSVESFLPDIGVEKVEWVLHTHYHRDQSIGSVLLKKSGAQIAIGSKEAHLLDRPDVKAPFAYPEKLLLNGELPDWGTRYALFESPGVDTVFSDEASFFWNDFKITPLQTPGHTSGSISYLVEKDSGKYCFTGDLILDGGVVRDFYSMQWIYLQNPGVDSSLVSLQKIKEQEARILLPSHGEIIKEPGKTIDILVSRLNRIKSAFGYERAGRWNWTQFVQVSAHVIQDGGSTSQIIISESGEALLYDCGDAFSVERLNQAKAKFGIERIDVIIPSHWHFDHVDGIYAIAEQEGSELWVWEGLAEYISHPERFPVTGWTGRPLAIDRILKEGEEFEWGGYRLKVFHHPVHTRQQMALYAKVDGLDIYMMADGTGYTKNGTIRSPLHCYNGISLQSIIKSAQSFYDADPYICLPAHSNVFAVGDDEKKDFLRWAVETTDVIRAVLPPPVQNLGFDPYWSVFYPVRTKAKPGQVITVSLRIKNYTDKPSAGSYSVKSYGHLNLENHPIEFNLAPNETKSFPVAIHMDETAEPGIHILTADIEVNGQVFAEYPQAYIEVDE